MTAEEWSLPPAVVQYWAELDAEGKRLAAAAKWWEDAKADGTSWEHDPSINHRSAAPMHFVQGRSSPWYIEGLRSVLSPEAKAKGAGRLRKLWAVYLGPVFTISYNFTFERTHVLSMPAESDRAAFHVAAG